MTAIRKAEDDLKRLAHYDPLTDLPNRLLAMDRLGHAMERNVRGQYGVGLMLVDLDHFKNVNDTLGHNAGDELLRIVANRVRASVRSEDTVARLGGDEFGVIVEEASGIDLIANMADKIISALSRPIQVAGTELVITASIGISLYPEDARIRENLIRAADTAMYAAKELGRNRYAFYAKEMTVNAVRYMALSQDLHRGLEQDELRLYFQPQVSIRSGMISGVEALVRWQHPEKGILGADQIIPIAEKSGLIVALGEWILGQACLRAQEWRSAGLAPLRVAVNVSPYQMRSSRLLTAVERALQETHLPARLLEIEITESVLQDEENSLQSYSCLSSLKTLPIQRLKIDRTFIQDLPQDANNVAITEAIILMARRLGLSIVAEGVETQAQLEFLRDQGCEEVQGFLYWEPMTAPMMADTLKRNASHRPVGRFAS
jgi:diguanylate cyclase (GGDEF)-like protein